MQSRPHTVSLKAGEELDLELRWESGRLRIRTSNGKLDEVIPAETDVTIRLKVPSDSGGEAYRVPKDELERIGGGDDKLGATPRQMRVAISIEGSLAGGIDAGPGALG